jgi:hypothetical protein
VATLPLCGCELSVVVVAGLKMTDHWCCRHRPCCPVVGVLHVTRAIAKEKWDASMTHVPSLWIGMCQLDVHEWGDRLGTLNFKWVGCHHQENQEKTYHP